MHIKFYRFPGKQLIEIKNTAERAICNIVQGVFATNNSIHYSTFFPSAIANAVVKTN